MRLQQGGEDQAAAAAASAARKKKPELSSHKAAAEAAARAAPANIRTYFYEPNESPLAALTRTADGLDGSHLRDAKLAAAREEPRSPEATQYNPLASLLEYSADEDALEAAAAHARRAREPPASPVLDRRRPRSPPGPSMDAEIASFMGDLEASGLLTGGPAEREAELQDVLSAARPQVQAQLAAAKAQQAQQALGTEGKALGHPPIKEQQLAVGSNGGGAGAGAGHAAGHGAALTAAAAAAAQHPPSSRSAGVKPAAAAGTAPSATAAAPAAAAAAAQANGEPQGQQQQQQQQQQGAGEPVAGGSGGGSGSGESGSGEGGSGEEGGDGGVSEQRVLGEVAGAPGWEEVLDVASGTTYFWHSGLQETRGSWDPPPGAQVPSYPRGAQASAEAAATQGRSLTTPNAGSPSDKSVISDSSSSGLQGLLSGARASEQQPREGGAAAPEGQSMPLPDEGLGARLAALSTSLAVEAGWAAGGRAGSGAGADSEARGLAALALEAEVHLQYWRRLAECQRAAAAAAGAGAGPGVGAVPGVGAARPSQSLWPPFEELTRAAVRGLEERLPAARAETQQAQQAQHAQQQQQQRQQRPASAGATPAQQPEAAQQLPAPAGSAPGAGPAPAPGPAPPVPQEEELEEGEMPPLPDEDPPPLPPEPEDPPPPGTGTSPPGAPPGGAAAAPAAAPLPPEGAAAYYQAWSAQQFAQAAAAAAGAAVGAGAGLGAVPGAVTAAAAAKPAPSGPIVRPPVPAAQEVVPAPAASSQPGAPSDPAAAAPGGLPAPRGPEQTPPEGGEEDRKRKAGGGGGAANPNPNPKRKKGGPKLDKQASALINKWAAVKRDMEEQQLQEETRGEQEAAKFAAEMERRWEAEAAAWRAQQAAAGVTDDPFAQLAAGSRGGEGGAAETGERPPSPGPPGGDPGALRKGEKPDLAALAQGLPPGWKPVWDKGQRRVYYSNPGTKETSRDRP